MIKSGTSTGATNTLVDEIARAQQSTGIIATTQFLKEQSTYSKFFGSARPNWWLYLWDHLTSRLVSRKSSTTGEVLLTDPEFIKLNNELDILYTLFEQFIQIVRKQAVTT